MTDVDRLARIMEKGFETLADLLRETKDELSSRIDETNHRLDETNQRLGRLETRFDNFVDIAGKETRKLRRDVDRLADRVHRIEGRLG